MGILIALVFGVPTLGDVWAHCNGCVKFVFNEKSLYTKNDLDRSRCDIVVISASPVERTKREINNNKTHCYNYDSVIKSVL